VIDALSEARDVQGAAARVGFDWPDAAGPRSKLREEIDELDRALALGSRDSICDELGDVLFSVVNLSRFIAVDPVDALRRSTRKFSTRFARLNEEVARQGRRVEECSLLELDAVWEAMKSRETGGGDPAF
jgi:ATP diphosphatase